MPYGITLDYEIYVSTDGSTWGSPVAAGTWDWPSWNGGKNYWQEEREVSFPYKSGRYFRFMSYTQKRYNETPDDFVRVAEVGVKTIPPGSVPKAPEALTAVLNESAPETYLTWSDMSGFETGFRIQRATNANFSGASVVGTAAANTTNYTDSTLTRDRPYYYRVCATNANGSGSWSDSAAVYVPAVDWGETALVAGSSWKYRKGTSEPSDPRSAWRAVDFVEGGDWQTGTAPVGYGEAEIVTTLGDMQNNYSSFFLRKTFTVSSLDDVTRLRARVDYDDGFILWINGERVLDRNEPDGEQLFDSLASAGHESGEMETVELPDPEGYLELGQNVAAVQVFNFGINSSDALFDLALETFKKVADTKFSADRGFYDAPFSVTVSTATAGATILYTTDGSVPTPVNGQAGGTSVVVAVTGTTSLRAAAFKGGWTSTDVDTQTYLFLAQVLQQTGRDWDRDGMDPDIVADARYSGTLTNDLKAIPSLCIAGAYADVLEPHLVPDEEEEWYAPVSIEWIRPDGEQGFQADCGMQPGGASGHMGWTYNKQQYNFAFRKVFGQGKLNYALFPDSKVESFDAIRIRGAGNDRWSAFWAGGSLHRAQYVRDDFGRRTQRDQGWVSSHSTWAHVYINGNYWGMYNVCEKPNESFCASHYGGAEEDYDVVKVTAYSSNPNDPLVVGGNATAWKAMLSYANGHDLATDAYYQMVRTNYLDVGQYIDYHLIELWGANGDWVYSATAQNNWRAACRTRNREPGDPLWQIFMWDYELTMELSSSITVNKDISSSVGVGNLHGRMRSNVDYKMEFADRAYKHMSDGGVLSTDAATTRYQAACDQIDRAVVPESARWGDSVLYYRTDPLNRDDHWVPFKANLLSGWLTQRSAILLNQLRNQGLYPVDVEPPSFSQHGGAIGAGFRLTLTNPNGSVGTMYYTADGTDPRVFGGASRGARAAGATVIANGGSFAVSRTTHVKARVYKNNNTWSAVQTATFNYTAHYPSIKISEIMYNPLGGSDYEFIEIHNVSGLTVGLSEMYFTGLDYTFPPGTELAADAYYVIANNAAAFQSRYGSAPDGQFDGRLDNGGERIRLCDRDGLTVTEVRYNDKTPWPEEPDGDGYSLVFQGTGDQDDAAKWRRSNLIGGTPGYGDGGGLYNVVINEALTHTDLPTVDAVELYNAGDASVNIGGWYLSDTTADYKKYLIPSTSLAPGAYAVFDENDFGTWSLDSHGDEVYLTKWDGSSNLQYLATERFGGADNGVAFGRHICSDGGVDFVAQNTSNTLGGLNAYPNVGPVVINEIMYHPLDPADHEYVELLNIAQSAVNLYDPGAATNRWRLDGAVAYTFPSNISLVAGEYVLVVPTNEAAFRARYPGVPGGVRIFGPYAGRLNNGGESVKLWKPDTPDAEGVPQVLVDRVKYNDNSPWPEGADGDGPSLERIAPALYGNDPANWAASPAAGGTPGVANGGTLVSKTSGWKYYDRGTDLGSAWRAGAYDDSAWEDGNAPLGYSASGVGIDTEIAFGPDPANKYPTTYFRKRFVLNDPGAVTGLTLRVCYDDGYVAYLNGEEVARGGMPGGAIGYGTLATAQNGSTGVYQQVSLAAHIGKLVGGAGQMNVLAVEVHQVSASSSDLFMDLELCRASSQTPVVDTPVIVPGGGSFVGSTNVTITCATAGATIYYTTDGSSPTSNATEYVSAFSVTDTVDVKARAYKDGLLPSWIAVAHLERIYGETVATPTLSPAGGDFWGTITVTAQCATAGATIYYTTDGTAPVNGPPSIQYAAPFVLADSRTISARGFKALCNPSGTAVASFTDRTPQVRFDGAAATCSEACGSVNLAVSLSAASPKTATIDYAVSGGTATGGDDYTLAAGTLTIPAGQTARTIALIVTDDTAEEPAETVEVTLNAPSNAALGSPGVHTLTIRASDRLFTAYNDFYVTTGEPTANITGYTRSQSGLLVDYATGSNAPVTLGLNSGGSGPLVQGALSVAGKDAYNVFNGKVGGVGLIGYGDPDLVVTLSDLESSLEYEVILFGNRDVAGYTTRLTTTTLSGAEAFSNESTPGATFSGVSDPATTICNGYNTSAGYVARYTDIRPGPDEQITLTIGSNATKFYINAIRVRALGQSQSVVQFAQTADAGPESADTALLAVNLAPAPTSETRVDYAVSGGTATGGGADYTLAAGTLTFAPGQTARNVPLQIVNDSNEETAETVEVTLSSPFNAVLGVNVSCTYTIEDDDGVRLMFRAFNDLAWSAGQLADKITRYTGWTTSGLSTNGPLVDYDTGSNVAATVAVAADGAWNDAFTNQGASATDGEAAGLFSGIVDCKGLASGGDIHLQFGGLDPDWLYTLVLFGNRDEPSYTTRTTAFTIQDVAAFSNESSAGVEILGSGGAWPDDVARFVTGYNTASGLVARFTNIRAGSDQDFTVLVSTGDSRYVNAFLLEGYQGPSSGPDLVEKIGAGTAWRYHEGTTEASSPVTAWRARGFDDAAWDTGPAPIGYGCGAVVYGTLLTNMQYNYSSLFMRKAFTVADPAMVSALQFWVQHDDGFILWLNGAEVTRVFMSGTAGQFMPYDTLAQGSGILSTWGATLEGAQIPALVAGTNVVTMQVFNNQLYSSDLCGELTLAVVQDSTLSTDTDGDRDAMADDWELQTFLGTGVVGCASAEDKDEDGASNLAEFIAGTGATNPASHFDVDVTAVDGGVRVAFEALAADGAGYEGLDRYYALEYTPGAQGIRAGAWYGVPNYGNILGEGQIVAYTNAAPDTNTYYRGRVWLTPAD